MAFSNPRHLRTAIIMLAMSLGFCSCRAHSVESQSDEVMRVSSPDGRIDAVAIYESYDGAIGGFEWRVYLVTKGKKVTKELKPLFVASTLAGEKLKWRQDHLLEIKYDLAHIESFRNLWGLSEVENVGSTGERDYYVEVRLAPSTPDFSILTPDGSFRR
jgi:hypothetical protein